MTITLLAEQPAEHIITFHNAGSFYEYVKCELDAVRRRLELARVEGEAPSAKSDLVDRIRSLVIFATARMEMWDEDQDSCDRCESTKNVEPILDPWGGRHGFMCANCEASQEDDYYGATSLAAENQVRMDEARKLK